MNALLQSAVNFWMADALETRARCAALSGRVVVIEVADLGVHVRLTPRQEGLEVALGDDPAAEARIRARSLDLLALSRASGAAGAPGRLQVEGDAELAEAVRDLMRSVSFDPEERLAQFVGDVPAHELGRCLHGLRGLARDTGTRVLDMLGEYLKHETGDIVCAEEIAGFVSAVDALRDDVERAAAILDAFARRAAS